jgi:hypothetical protein
MPSDIPALEGDRRGEQGADLHGSASYKGCACHTAGPAPQTVNKFAHYLECVRGDTPLGPLPNYLVEGVARNVRYRPCLSSFSCSCHELRVF